MTKLSKKAPQDQTDFEFEDGLVYVELSPEVQERLREAARGSGQSEADLIRDAIAEAVSKRTTKKRK